MGKAKNPDTPNYKKYGVPLYGSAWAPSVIINDSPQQLDRKPGADEVSGEGSTPSPTSPTYLVFSGGGGEGRSGIPNSLLLAEFDFASNSLSDMPHQVGISIFKILLQVTRPKTVMLYREYTRDEHISQSPSLQGWYDQSSRLPLILSIEAPINFANTTTYLNERILRWVEEYEAEYAEEDRKKHSTLRFVVLDLSAVSAIDTSGVSIFSDLKKALEKKGLELALVNPVGEVMEKLQRWDEGRDILRPDSIFLTVGEAVASLSSAIKCQPSNQA